MIVDEGEWSRRPAYSRRRYARLRSLFPPIVGRLINSRIARLCVLFEDLRIEVTGLDLPPPPGIEETRGLVARFDVAGYKFRQLYFLRRSICTCSEFAEAIRLLDELPEFGQLLSGFPADSQRVWYDAVSYFRQHGKFWKDIRNDVGGHFGSKAAEFAVESFLVDASGFVEMHAHRSGQGGIILGFASEIAATASLRNLPGNDAEEKVKALLNEVKIAYPHAIKAVEYVVNHHLWAKTG